MLEFAYLVPLFPLLGAVILLAFGRSIPREVKGPIATGSVVAGAIAAVMVARDFVASGEATYRLPLWRWLDLTGVDQGHAIAIAPEFALRIDPLSLVMMLVVTVAGSLIHLYASEYMEKDAASGRFFAVFDLFVAAMLLLVMSDDLVGLFFGWEGVGVCSFLLIGHWWQKAENVRAARKAFLVTRIGDVGLTLAMVLLFQAFGTLQIQQILELAPQYWQVGAMGATLVAALIFVGAMGKSGQVPLHVWLPDAMAGPTPVSAMIHAATMVAAGVYLIARLYPLFVLAPIVQTAVLVVGTLTMLIAGTSALAQTDLKRILAYSTVSQLGYMFMGLGVGAVGPSMFHFFTHAGFKALLFLSAGLIIEAAHHEQDVTKLGGLRTKLPFAFAVTAVGCGTLAALPLVTSAFYSKDAILADVWALAPYGPVFAVVGLFGGFITAVYSFRLLFLVFFGPQRTEAHDHAGWRMKLPLVVFAIFALVAGFAPVPAWLGSHEEHGAVALGIEAASGLLALAGAGVAWALYGRGEARVVPMLKAGWWFDDVYNAVLVRPLLALVGNGRPDAFEVADEAAGGVVEFGHGVVSTVQTGRLGVYVTALVVGSALVLAWVEFA